MLFVKKYRIIIVKIVFGNIILKFILNLFFIFVCCVLIVVIVVFEIIDRLLLNIVFLIIVVIVSVVGIFVVCVNL